MAFYDSLAATALQLLTQFGQPVTLRRVAEGAYVGGRVAQTPTDQARVGAAFGFGASVAMQRGEAVQAEDVKLLLDVNGDTPTTKDRILLADGTLYKILSVDTSGPAGTPVLHTLHLRR